MNFLSLSFLFSFLPFVLLIWIFLTRHGLNLKALTFLLLSSAYFYFEGSIHALFFVTISATLNFGIAKLIVVADGKKRRQLLFFGIAINLLFLSYFKYTTILASAFYKIFDIQLPIDQVEFPIGISFYTISQIAYLIMLKDNKETQYGLIQYFFFVFYFPKIMAGPVMYAKDFISQLGSVWDGHRSRLEDVSLGLSLFCFGAFKKIGIAEPLGKTANVMFSYSNDSSLSCLAAWNGILSYTLQLYFDFSAYSDMAIGVSRMFGFKLPQNFNSPLRATSLIGFWQGWHMTMTRFFMSFIYTPIALSLTRKEFSHKSGKVRLFFTTVAFPITFTFVLSGLWHGPTLNFIYFGLINGFGLSINYAWHNYNMLPKIPKIVSWFLMLFVIMTSLVFVRAPDISIAFSYLIKLFNPLNFLSDNLGFKGDFFASNIVISPSISMLQMLHLGISLVIVTLMPNTQWIMRNYSPTLNYKLKTSGLGFLSKITWRPSFFWAIICLLCILIALLRLNSQQFIYYSF
jgi:alginate O-acetyltransferase complex protein AlgI